jgi:hypothetical protein
MLVDQVGLQDAGKKAYTESLWSPLILPGNRQVGLSLELFEVLKARTTTNAHAPTAP